MLVAAHRKLIGLNFNKLWVQELTIQIPGLPLPAVKRISKTAFSRKRKYGKGNSSLA